MSRSKTQLKTANGLGSIRKKTVKHKDGSIYECWEARITLEYDPITKKQKIKSFSGRTQTEVMEKLKAFTNNTREDVPIPTEKSITLSQWLQIWRAEYLFNLKASTVHLYERDIELYIIPHLGESSLNTLTTADIQRFYNRLLLPTLPQKKALSPKTVKDIHGVLHQALQQAISNGEIEKNPCDGCKLPKVQKKEIIPLEDYQVISFLELIEGHTHEYLYKITLFTGMREGEVLGLSWDDVDLKRGEIHIRKQLRKEQKKGGEYYFSSPKNGKSRTIAISPSVIQLFKWQKQKQHDQMIEVGPDWIDSNLVFTNPVGDRLSYRTVYDCFKRIVKKMGHGKLRFHDLRHQYAVISIKNGDDIKTVQNNLGHATAAFTLDVYGHITDQMRHTSANRMEKYISSLQNA